MKQAVPIIVQHFFQQRVDSIQSFHLWPFFRYWPFFVAFSVLGNRNYLVALIDVSMFVGRNQFVYKSYEMFLSYLSQSLALSVFYFPKSPLLMQCKPKKSVNLAFAFLFRYMGHEKRNYSKMSIKRHFVMDH